MRVPRPVTVARELVESPHRRMVVVGRLWEPWWSWRFASFGDGSVLRAPEWVAGARHIAIGSRVTIHAGAWLAAEQSTWALEQPGISIGDDCVIRSRVTLSACAGIDIGTGVSFGGGCTVIDSDHTWLQGRPRVVDNHSDAAPITIGDHAWIGDGARLLRGASVGRFTVVAAGSVVRTALPDLVVAAGVPARVVASVESRMAPDLWRAVQEG